MFNSNFFVFCPIFVSSCLIVNMNSIVVEYRVNFILLIHYIWSIYKNVLMNSAAEWPSWRRLQTTLCFSHFAGSIQFTLVMNWIWIYSLKYSKAQQPQQHWAKDNIFCKPSALSLAMLPTLRLPSDALYLYFPNTPHIHIYCHINLENRIRIIIYNE